jgi:flavodoxin
LKQKKIAVFSLGDRTFSHYCASAEILAGWVSDKGGSLLAAPIKIDGYPYDMSEILTWLDQVIAKV